MDKMYEEPKVLKLCGIEYDISNVSKHKEDVTRDYWNRQQKKDLNAKQYTKLVNTVGLMLIRQDFIVLKRRYDIKTAIKEYLKRLLLTTKKITQANRKEYEQFSDWVVFILYGLTPEELKKKSEIELLGIKMYEMLIEKNISVDQCLESLQTFAEKLDGQPSIQKPTQSVY